MSNKLHLTSFRLKNFKAVQDSKRIKFTPLTAFIGNNGSGKSSIVEGLETIKILVDDGLDAAMQHWRGYEHIKYKGTPHKLITPADPDERPYYSNPIGFFMEGNLSQGKFKASTEMSIGAGGDELFFRSEKVTVEHYHQYLRHENHLVEFIDYEEMPNFDLYPLVDTYNDNFSVLSRGLLDTPSQWQFLSLAPEAMGSPIPRKMTRGHVVLNKNGSNIAEYLLDIRERDQQVFDGIIETLQFVLPYAKDMQPSLTSELERTVYLQLSEQDFKVPGWLLSTGTLRILALLAVLRHPNPAPLIVIEEIENGLDPRTIQLVIDEIRRATNTGKTQVIITTHSPYLLDLLPLEYIVLVERQDGSPTFTRPADNKDLKIWAEQFSPGQLYTMNGLRGQ